jgi:MraZ protein
MDSNGRVLLSQTLRNFAGLDKHIMMVGQVDKFEVWDEAGWNRRRDELLDDVPQLHEEPSDALRSLVL